VTLHSGRVILLDEPYLVEIDSMNHNLTYSVCVCVFMTMCHFSNGTRCYNKKKANGTKHPLKMEPK